MIPAATCWPRTGHCSACREAAEQYPSGRWRHLTKPCRYRSYAIVPADSWPHLMRPTFQPGPPTSHMGR